MAGQVAIGERAQGLQLVEGQALEECEISEVRMDSRAFS
jgi:hypothetical protein